MRKISAVIAAFILPCLVWAQAPEKNKVSSPDQRLSVEFALKNGAVVFSVSNDGTPILKDCAAQLEVEELRAAKSIRSVEKADGQEHVQGVMYKVPQFDVKWNGRRITLDNGLALELRVFDNGVAYRFLTKKGKGKTLTVKNERAEMNFAQDGNSWLPYSTNPKKPEAMAFQATYDEKMLSAQDGQNLAFLPAVVDCGAVKVTLMESDLLNYPGMFVKASGTALKGWFSPVPKTFDFYPWRKQKYATSTENYIAKISGNRTLPWRILAISRSDAEMPANNLVYALATPNQTGDTSWIKPGMVAWDWWNDWGLTGVPFKAGINMDTYRYFIDFAAKNKLPYIILDEGWYEPKSGDMLTTISDIDLPALVDYGKQRGVKIILWTVFNVLDEQLEAACKKYSDMGIAGFKVDFLDRDDQEGVQMAERIAKACAKHHLLLDYHGFYKPTGLNRTYPNIINFEGVFGMEEAKWSKADEKDMPRYDVTFPFIRMQCGPVDFTPGGMRNATKKDFQPIYYNPLTMGTRCHQLAMYVVHDSPLTMLADNPTAYEREPEYTAFIAAMPNLWDETKILDGKLGEYIVVARRTGNTWYVAGQTNWDARDLSIDPSSLGISAASAVLYTDGINAEKNASDYLVQQPNIQTASPLTIHLASGGGFVLKIN